jgi:hypothetical protein
MATFSWAVWQVRVTRVTEAANAGGDDVFGERRRFEPPPP